MSKLNDAVVDIKNLSNRFKAFMQVADALEELNNFDNARKEYIKSRDNAIEAYEKANASLQEMNVKLADTKGELEDVRDRIIKERDDAQRIRANVISDAKKEADQIVDDATKKKNAIVQERMDIEKNIALLSSQQEEAKKELESLQNTIKETKNRISSL